MRRLEVVDPFQVVHDGQVHKPGDVVEIADEVGALWLASGWVKPAAAAKKAAPRKRT
ncbi:hypothetical protein [Mycobacterium kyogaense]|uniref:hypothetical protein n=1 Tax=Mycobacterium kyogaense TaxID=2212479 RepID=UPI0013C3F947|nr:hypothetical protein [Mycobacterium kyogaense]